MNKCFNKEICSILKDAENEMISLKHPYVGTEHLLLSLLKCDKVKKICYRYSLTYTNFRNELLNIMGSSSKKSEVVLYTPLLNLVIDSAYNKSYDDHEDMNELHLLSSLLNESDGIAIRIIDNMGISTKEITNELNKSVLINELGINLNKKAYNEEILLREKEIYEIMQVLLRKNKNNPILIGKSGVGKTAVIEELARKISRGDVPDKLKDKEIIQINTSTLIAGTKYRGEFEERVNNLIKEVMNNKNIILFIDEIHNIVKTGSSDGSIDAANILKPYLARGDIALIGATTTEEYNEYFKKDSALIRRFAPVIISEPSLKDMEVILTSVKKNFEKYYNLSIPIKTITYLIKVCDEYLPNQCNPDKSIEVLDTACSRKILENQSSKKVYINIEDIETVINSRINLYNINYKIEEVKEELNNLYDKTCVESIIELFESNKQKHSLELNNRESMTIIKHLSNKLNVHLINIDCREYNDEYSLSKLLNNNYLYNEIESNPYSIITFTNYKDSNKIVFNLINTMIHNGYITNNRNEKISLSKSLIFLINSASNNSIGFKNKLLIETEK